MQSIKQFLQQLVETQGVVSIHNGIAIFQDGSSFDLSSNLDPHLGPTLERFDMCNAGSNPGSYTIEAARSGDYVRETGEAIYSEVRVNVFAGQSNKCLVDVLVGLTDTGEPRVLISANGVVDEPAICVHPLRKVAAAVEVWRPDNDDAVTDHAASAVATNSESSSGGVVALNIPPAPEHIVGGELPTYLTVEAHCLDPETVATLQREYGVTVWDRAEEPWSVVFQGPRAGLIKMYREHWGHQLAASDDLLKRIPPLYATYNRAKAQILEDVRAGLVRVDTVSFSELDDQRDANCYGDFCEDYLLDALVEHFGGRDAHEGMPDGARKYIDDVQAAINVWLREGGAKTVATDTSQ